LLLWLVAFVYWVALMQRRVQLSIKQCRRSLVLQMQLFAALSVEQRLLVTALRLD
jgi:hypothetical protein